MACSGIRLLTEREKETLRLLLAGHDAKSAARQLGLSVHTINDRLRDARRKLEVSSSREAARVLAEADRGGPESFAPKQLGMSGDTPLVPSADMASRRSGVAQPLAWLGGGMLIMLLLIAIFVLLSDLQGGEANRAESPRVANPAAAASLGFARAWLALVDGQSWGQSWATASTLFKTKITAPQWTARVEPVRKPLGQVASRTFQDVTATSSLPGAPPGAYEVIQFRTDFAQKEGAIETVILAREGESWRVAGYFIR